MICEKSKAFFTWNCGHLYATHDVKYKEMIKTGQQDVILVYLLDSKTTRCHISLFTGHQGVYAYKYMFGWEI